MSKNKIRWGVLSTAKIGMNSVIPAINASEGGQVTAISSRSLAKAQTAAKDAGIAKAYGSYEELLADPDIDAVYNPLPISMHAEWSIKAAEAGKPVLCEKPLALNADEVKRMIAIFADRDLLLAEALMFRYHPLTRKMLEIIRGGGIGTLRSIHATFNVTIEDPDDIRFRKETGGGSLLDLGCYCTSALTAMAGEKPNAAKALAGFNAADVDTNFAGILSFPSGVLGHFACGLGAQFDCGYGASGTTGRVLIDHGGMCAWPGEDFVIKYWHGDVFEKIVVPAGNPYQLLVEDFQRAVRNGGRTEFSSSEALGNLELMDQLLNDARSTGG